MIARDELVRVFRLLHKHRELFISAAMEHSGVIDESRYEIKDIKALIDARLVWRPASDEPIRLSREISSLFDRVLRDPRRMSLDTDIGGFLVSIENAVNRYKDAVKIGSEEDTSHYLGQIERLVDDLRNSLLDSSSQLWQKIASDFGYVSSLDLKIKENTAVLNQAKRLFDSLELITRCELQEMAGHNPRLRRLLLRWLAESVEKCRKEALDASYKLGELLFEFRQQRSIGRLVAAFYKRYESNLGYEPYDYSSLGDIPEILNQVAPLSIGGHADIDDPLQEAFLAGLVEGIRKEPLEAEPPSTEDAVEVEDDDPPLESSLSPLAEAVQAFYKDVIISAGSLSALDHRPDAEVENDVEIWMYAVISRYNKMLRDERVLFDLQYEEELDPVFNGRFLVRDVTVSLRRGISLPH